MERGITGIDIDEPIEKALNQKVRRDDVKEKDLFVVNAYELRVAETKAHTWKYQFR